MGKIRAVGTLGIQATRDLAIRPLIVLLRHEGHSWKMIEEEIAEDPTSVVEPSRKRWTTKALRGAARRLGLPTGQLKRRDPRQFELPGFHPENEHARTP